LGKKPIGSEVLVDLFGFDVKKGYKCNAIGVVIFDVDLNEF
jgi:hypothetical protein